MKDYIINSFILQEKNTLIDVYNYIKFRYDNSMEINDVKIELIKLIKNNIIFFHNKNYELSKEGNVILNDNKYYYSKIIIRFYKKYNKNHRKYKLKEIRTEQQQLRNYLIYNKEHKCVICDKKLPLCLLETAHLKPRCLLNDIEKYNNSVVEFMCRYCHNLYDNGHLGIYKGILCTTSFIDKFDLFFNKNTKINCYNINNKYFFDFHFKFIFNNYLPFSQEGSHHDKSGRGN
jgi:hypothetical protein